MSVKIEIEGLEIHPWRKLRRVKQNNAVAYLLKGVSEIDNKILSSYMGFTGSATVGLKIRVNDLDLLMTICYDEPGYTTVNFYSFKNHIKIDKREVEGNTLVECLVESGLCESIHNWIHDNRITFAESEGGFSYRYEGPSPGVVTSLS